MFVCVDAMLTSLLPSLPHPPTPSFNAPYTAPNSPLFCVLLWCTSCFFTPHFLYRIPPLSPLLLLCGISCFLLFSSLWKTPPPFCLDWRRGTPMPMGSVLWLSRPYQVCQVCVCAVPGKLTPCWLQTGHMPRKDLEPTWPLCGYPLSLPVVHWQYSPMASLRAIGVISKLLPWKKNYTTHNAYSFGLLSLSGVDWK